MSGGAGRTMSVERPQIALHVADLPRITGAKFILHKMCRLSRCVGRRDCGGCYAGLLLYPLALRKVAVVDVLGTHACRLRSYLYHCVIATSETIRCPEHEVSEREIISLRSFGELTDPLQPEQAEQCTT